MVTWGWKAVTRFALCLSVAGGAGVLPPTARGAESTTEERVAELEHRVAELEAALKKALEAGPIKDTAELQREIDMLTRELEKAKLGKAAAPRELRSVYGLGPAASKVYGEEKGLSIGGYGETLFSDFAAQRDDGSRSGETSTLDLLRAVLYFGYKFNDRIVFNSEIEYEHASTGEGDEEKGEVAVEFANLDFLLHKSANVRAGLMLMPIGFINELHEPPVYLGATRPQVETFIIPSTWREVGVGVFGDLGPFSYRGYIVSGLDASGFSASTGLRGGRQDGSQADARDLAFTARADYHGVPGLLVGASYYTGDSGQGASSSSGDVVAGGITMYDVHAEYRFKGLQVRGLWASTSVNDAGDISEVILGLDPSDPNDSAGSVGTRIGGWYGEVGYDILSWMGEKTKQEVIPYLRYERLDTQDGVPEGFTTTGANDVKVITYGVAYKPILNVSIKLDFQDFKRGDGSGTDQINVALGYLF